MDPSGGDLPCSTLPRFLCGAASLVAGRGLGRAGNVLCLVAGGRRLSGAVEILPHVAGRVGPRLSRRCPLPLCWRGGTSAEPAVSSASLASRGLVDASGAGTRQSWHCPLPRPRSRQTAPRPLHRPLAMRQRTSPAPSRPRPAANEAAPHRKRGRVEHGRSPPLGSK